MGAMKRLVGWNQSGWPIPQPLQALAGLVPFRPTAEELADRRKDAAEAKSERAAIQAEARESEAPPARPKPSPAKLAKAEADAAKFEAARGEMIADFRAAVRIRIRHALEGTSPPTEDASPTPVRYVQTTMF